MTETTEKAPGTEEPLILERLSDLDDQAEYLDNFPDIRGRAVVNPTGDEVGMVDDLYVNPRTGQVEMAAITFTPAGGYGGKKILVPVNEVQIKGNEVRVVAQEDRVRLAPEFTEAGPMYEPYYEYWSSQTVGAEEEPSSGFIRPPGRLELEGEEEEEEETVYG